MLEVQYENDARDLPSALRALPWRRRLLLKGAMWLMMGLSAMPATVLLAALGDWIDLVAGWSVWAALALFGRYRVWTIQRRALRAASARLRPVTLRISAERVESETEQGWANYDWLSIDHVAGGRRHLVMVTRFLTFFVIPRRAFSAPQQAEAFLQAAREHQRRAHELGVPQLVASGTQPADDSVCIVYHNTSAELKKLHAEGLPKPGQPRRKRLSWRVGLLLTLGGLVLLLVAARDPGNESMVGLAVFMVLSLSTLVAIRRLPLWMLGGVLQRISLGEKTLTISPEGVSRVEPDCESFVSWQEFSSIEEDERQIVFFQNDRTHMAHVIPKHAFATVTEAERFMSIAERLYQQSRPTPELPQREETGNPYQSPIAS